VVFSNSFFMKLKADEDALIADEEAKDADDEDVDELPVYS